MIVQAVGGGNLELSQFLPLVADSLLESLDPLTNACDIFARHCVAGIEADEDSCRRNIHNSTAAADGADRPIGYDAAEQLAGEVAAAIAASDIRQLVIDRGLISAEEFDELTSPRTGDETGRHRSRIADAMSTAPKGLRLHIGLFGRRNAGKSSLLNAMTRQEVSIVSEVAGTTTDPVEKPMELLPLGPVLWIDTAGRRRRRGAGRKTGAKDAASVRPHRRGHSGGRRGLMGRVRGENLSRAARSRTFRSSSR